MNLNTLSAAISSTGVALLDSNSTFNRIIINVQPQRLWSSRKDGLEGSDLNPAKSFIAEEYDFSSEFTQHLFAEALRLSFANIIAVSGASEDQMNEHKAFKLLNVYLPRLFNQVSLEEAEKLNKQTSFIRYSDYGVSPEKEAWFAGIGSKAQKEDCRKFYLLPQHLDKLALLPVDFAKGINPTQDKGYEGNFAIYLNLVKGV